MSRLPVRPTVVWAALVLATGATWFVGAGASPLAARLGLAVLVVLGFAKAALIGLEFMELRHAGAPERRAFLAWVVVVGALCVAVAVL